MPNWILFRMIYNDMWFCCLKSMYLSWIARGNEAFTYTLSIWDKDTKISFQLEEFLRYYACKKWKCCSNFEIKTCNTIGVNKIWRKSYKFNSFIIWASGDQSSTHIPSRAIYRSEMMLALFIQDPSRLTDMIRSLQKVFNFKTI